MQIYKINKGSRIWAFELNGNVLKVSADYYSVHTVIDWLFSEKDIIDKEKLASDVSAGINTSGEYTFIRINL